MKVHPCIALVTIGVTLSACQPTPPTSTADTLVSGTEQNLITTPAAQTGTNARVIVLDPTTGKPSTDPSLQSAQTNSLNRAPVERTPFDQLEKTVRPDGSMSIRLDDTYHSSLVATVDSEGDVSVKHVNNTSKNILAPTDGAKP